MKTKMKGHKSKAKGLSKTARLVATLPVVAGRGKRTAGEKARRSTLRVQAAISLALGDTYSDPLAGADWTPAQNLGLRADLTAFDDAYRDFDAAREASKQATQAFRAVVGECRIYRDQLIAAVRVATQGQPNPFKHQRLRLTQTASPKELAVWFQSMLLVVKKNQASLEKQLRADPMALTQAKAAKLMQAIGAQSLSRKLAPDLSKKQQAARAKLANSIERQRLAAMIAFPRNKDVLRKFVPVWVRKHRATKNLPVAAPAPAATLPASPDAAPAQPAAAVSEPAASQPSDSSSSSQPATRTRARSLALQRGFPATPTTVIVT